MMKKRKQIDRKTKELNWLMGGGTQLSIESKLLNLQNSHQAHRDLLHTNLGMRQQILCSEPSPK
jgi:hypothetical protein